MELIENDNVMGSSGKFGKRLIYRQRGAKTIIASRPARRKDPKTLLQKQARELFAEAILYAKSVIADDALKALYQEKVKGNQTAYNLAVADFCKPPEIRKHDVLNYTGQIGDKISIRAVDDFKVEWLKISIQDSADTLIEEGEAILSANGADWIYTTSVVNPTIAGTKLTISAADMPGNVSTLEVVL